MSDHNIEDFTQYAIETVDTYKISATDKRNLFANLYRFQNYFDASYTAFRVIQILLKNNYIQKIPIQQHPDYHDHKAQMETLDYSFGEWLPADFSDADGELTYAQKENESVFFFPEFGSKLWCRLFPADEEPRKVSVPQLFEILMSLAKVHNDEMMLKHAYQALLYGYFSGVETEEDGFPKDFSHWLKDKSLLALRNFLTENDVLKTSKSYAFFPRLSLNDEVKYSDPKSEAKLRFLMDKKIALEALRKLWEKANQPEENFTSKINLIKDFLDDKLSSLGYSFLNSKSDAEGVLQKFTWLKENNNEDFLFLTLTYERGLKGIYAEQLLQHSLLRKWQERAQEKSSGYYHFKRDLYNVLKGEEQDKFDKKFNNMGLWRYDVKKSEAALTKNLSELFEVLRLKENALTEIVNQNFPEKLFQKSAQDYVEWFENITLIPYDLLFNSLKEYLAILIYDAAQKGDSSKATEIISIFESLLNESYRTHNEIYQKELLPFFEAVKNHQKAKLPLLHLK